LPLPVCPIAAWSKQLWPQPGVWAC
jgi:hypothetical protein